MPYQLHNIKGFIYMRTPRYRREIAELAAILTAHGIAEQEIIRLLAVNEETFSVWRKKHRELSAALAAPSTADQAEAALLKRALGFRICESTAEEIIDKKSGETLEVLKKRTISKDVPPDVRALLFFLKNRCPERWNEEPSDRYNYEAPSEEANL